MRSLWLALGLGGALLWATPAHAQFANHSLGLSIGYYKLFQDNLNWALPISLDGSIYVEGGFEATASFDFMILTVPTAAGTQQIIGLQPTVGFRYLFLEETIRPYIGLDLIYLHIFGTTGTTTNLTAQDYVGLSPKVGIDFFTSDTFSLGLQSRAAILYFPNRPATFEFGITAKASVYF